MHINRLQSTRPSTWLTALIACAMLMGAPLAVAQAPAAVGNAASPTASPEELEKLVGPIALYPDDLVGIILPASTNPVQIVQADRFLEKRKQDPKVQVDNDWDDSVKSLVNYPEVIKQMSSDLDWTVALGEAVVADQGAVLDAVQAFRRKAQAAGNLKTDSKQVVEVEKEVISIAPADPQVIYVPQYNPETVVVYSPAPVYSYYPAPYPSYYYPYPPGAALATGLIWGAAIGAAWGGNHYGCCGGGSINVDRNTNINVDRGNRGNRSSQLPSNRTSWKPNKQPGQVRGGAGRPTQGGRVGDAGRGGLGAGAGGRPSAGTRPAQQAGGGGLRQGGGGAATRQPSSGGGGLSGYGSGRQTSLNSSRGAASRSSMQSRGGGGGRAGGGGARGGGGGRGGGGRGGGGRR